MAAITMSMASNLARPAMSGALPRRALQPRLAARMVVRAEQGEQASTSSTGGETVFYAGKSYTQEEWKSALAAGTVATEAPPAPVAAKAVSIGDVMAFAGPAPELINGRLAMLGFVAALGAELSSGETVLQQVGQEPTLIALTFILFAAGSLVPLLNKAGSKTLGPFTPSAEMLNGRAAMIGFASLIVFEAVKGTALF